jgi:hypothetical protein
MKHSPVGASSAERWMSCPGSIQLSKSAPPSYSSIYARQGTAAHEVLELCFPDKDPMEFIGREMENGHVIIDEDAEAVRSAIESIKEHIGDLSEWDVVLEQRVHLLEIHKDLFGTADLVLISKDGKKIKIIDYKHGKGVPVNVIDNTQLKYYAIGAMLEYCREKYDEVTLRKMIKEFEEVEVAIAQPRCHHHDGPFRTWMFEIDDIGPFAVKLAQAVEDTEKKKPLFSAGDHCRWCPALALCPQMKSQVAEVAKTDFDAVSDPLNLNLPTAGTLSPAEVAKVLRFKDTIASWLKAVEGYASFLIQEGEAVPGYKIVKGKTNRKWSDENQAVGALSMLYDMEDLYVPRKLKSPAQVEKLLGTKDKKAIADFVYKPDGPNTLAKDADRRPEVTFNAADDFEAIE